jgi:SAM-dependent methyltransferase
VRDWPDPAPSYDRVADAYEARFAGELDGKPRDRELLLDVAGALASGDLVVDLGCGPGQIGGFVAGAGAAEAGVIVAGLDRSRRMAGLAGRRLAGGSVVGDLRSLPFATGAVAAVTAFYCLIHLPRSDLGLAVAEIARVLRLGGRALLTAHEGEGDVRVDEFLGAAVSVPATFFRLDELVDACEKAGLDVPVAERRPPYANEGDTVRLTVLAVRR